MNGRNNSGYRGGARMLPGIKQGVHPSGGGVPAGRSAPAQRMGGITPQTANAQKYAKGGKVKHADAAQDKKLIAQMLEKATGKKPVKRAMGGAGKTRLGLPKPKAIRRGTLVGGVK